MFYPRILRAHLPAEEVRGAAGHPALHFPEAFLLVPAQQGDRADHIPLADDRADRLVLIFRHVGRDPDVIRIPVRRQEPSLS